MMNDEILYSTKWNLFLLKIVGFVEIRFARRLKELIKFGPVEKSTTAVNYKVFPPCFEPGILRIFV
jgi:hypothetical protein